MKHISKIRRVLSKTYLTALNYYRVVLFNECSYYLNVHLNETSRDAGSVILVIRVLQCEVVKLEITARRHLNTKSLFRKTTLIKRH